ncbi:rhomboid family intramembrane serine protease [Paraburkholderia megapolitana]|uniref:Rhomboid protease GluP n=1 Tax=Paraburkholderia megapolitana TaxID=420953 RepID=A0A1I3GT31_9BURK|nr:rhomboid family intramembrane serine protease [Paraburkholderia megapolitana]QDQ83042.1 rhomboid family intramembrane serine protease [Paraburkholderia megapolitana]SFI26550.1 rhomboid protease GluP [Paraburkholderia megapolitana]
MSREEPTWGREATRFPDTAVESPKADRYDIAYGSGLYQRRGEYRARSFSARGAILFTGSDVRILALARRMFGADVEIDLQMPLRAIHNVVVTGRLVRFEAATETGKARVILIQAQSRPDARAIAAQLPNTMTPGFAAAAETLERFLDGVETRTPYVWVTWAIIALNVLVYAVMVGNGAGFPNIRSSAALAFGSNFGPNTLDGEWWRLITAVFVHFSLTHVAFNMIVLAQVGMIVERLFGNLRFAALYLFSGLTASLVSLYWHPNLNSAGASGAIFGVLGALLAYVIRYRSSMPATIRAQRFRSAILVVAFGLFNGLTNRGTDNAAHVGGLCAGLLMGWLLAQPVDPAEARSDPRDTALLAVSLAAFVSAALLFLAVRSNTSPEAREERAFALALQQQSAAEQKALMDLQSVAKMAHVPAQRTEFEAKIRTALWPEWDALYQRINNTPLPPGSAREPLRAALLRYYDDMRHAMLGLADASTTHESIDSPHAQKIKAVLEDARREHALVVKLAARR